MLVLDVGNTRIKWGCEANGELCHVDSARYGDRLTESLLQQCFDGVDCEGGVFIGSVASTAVDDCLADWFKRQRKCTPVFASSQAVQAGVTNGYREPHTLGVDRWAAMIAAYHQVQGALCVIDCGSAITLDVVTADGSHLGGLIMPGLSMMRTALVQQTAGISDAPGEPVLLADNTGDAVYSGSLQMAVAGLDRLIRQYTEQVDSRMRCMLTGGDGALVAEYLQRTRDYQPDLVLRGLALMASH